MRGAHSNGSTPRWRKKNKQRMTRYREYDRYWSLHELMARQADEGCGEEPPVGPQAGSGGPGGDHRVGENPGVPATPEGEAER
jgi:hypothetical protein